MSLETQPTQLLDTDPAIAFDIRLGKKMRGTGCMLDVDYDALRGHMQELGCPEDSSGLSLTFTDRKFYSAELGSYDTDTNDMRVSVRRKPQKTNKTLTHELKHYSDREQIEAYHASPINKVKYAIGKAASGHFLRGLIVATPATAVSAYFAAPNEALEMAAATSTKMLTASVVLSLLYSQNQFEQDAREASDGYQPVVRTKKL